MLKVYSCIVFSPIEVEVIYEHTTKGSQLRRLFVEYVVNAEFRLEMFKFTFNITQRKNLWK